MTVAAVAALVAGITACGGEGEDTDYSIPFETEGAVGNVVTFDVTANSTGTSNKITLKYRRSAAAAAEKITLQNAKYNIQLNGGEVKKLSGDLSFSLNEYGSIIDFADGVEVTDEMRTASGKYEGTKIKDLDDAAEYQCEISFAQQLAKGDVVMFQLVSAEITGEGAAKKADILPKVKVILIDADAKVDYYKEIFAYTKESEGGEGYPKVFKADAQIDEGAEVDHGLLDATGTFVGWNQVSVDAAKFTGLAAGDSLVFTYVTNNEKDGGGNVYHKIEVLYGEEDKFDFEVPVTEEEKTYTKVLSGAIASAIAEGGLKLQGHGVNVVKLTVVKGDGTEPEPPVAPEAGENLLSAAYNADWNLAGLIAAESFANAAESSVITFTYTGYNLEEENYYCKFKMIDKNWGKYGAGTITGATIPNSNDPVDDDGYMAIEVETPADVTTEFTVTYVPTAEEWTSIKSNGLAVAGHGATVTSVKFSNPD